MEAPGLGKPDLDERPPMTPVLPKDEGKELRRRQVDEWLDLMRAAGATL
jgi:hypothetical protein